MLLCTPAVAVFLVLPAPAQAAAHSGADRAASSVDLLTALLSPGQVGTIGVNLPGSAPDLTIRSSSLGLTVTDSRHGGSVAYRVSIGHHSPRALQPTAATRAVRPRHRATPRRATLSSRSAAGDGPMAVTAPGLVSVVPIGPFPARPLPTGLQPQVAERGVVVTPAATGVETALPVPPIGFWFAVVLLVLMLATATFVVGNRRYSVAASMTNR